jgi:trigger factor
LELLREQKATFETVDRPIQDGDQAVIDFLGRYKDGDAFPGGTAEKFNAEISPGKFIDGFVENLHGMKVGEEKDFDVTFPEAYGNADLAGKAATFHVHVHEVKGKQVPELNDAFAATLGDFNTVADWRAQVEKELSEEADDARENLIRQQLLDQLLEKADVDVPESMVRRETDHLINQYAQVMQAQGVNPQEMFAPERLDGWRANLREEALKRIRTSLTLSTVARANELGITPEEVDAEIVEYAGMYRVDPSAVRQQLIDSGAWNSLADEVLSNKILDWLREKAKVTEGPVPEKYAPKADEVIDVESVPVSAEA